MSILIRRFFKAVLVAWPALLLSVSAYALPTDGLVAYYPFNSNALDESGNGNHGLAVGAVLTLDRFGRADKAYYFDGVDDTVWIINSPSLNVQTAVSISAWFYLDSYPTDWVSIVNKWKSYVLQINPQHGLTLTIYDQQFKGVWRNVPVQQDFELGQWYHVAATFDEVSGVAQLYINGVAVSSEPRLDYGYPTVINESSDDVKLGSEQGSQWWHGAMDDVRIYNRALADTEVTELFNETPVAPQTVLNLTIDGLQINMVTGEVQLKANFDPADPVFQSLVTNPEVRLSVDLQTQSDDGSVRFGAQAQGQVPAETLQQQQILRYGSLPSSDTGNSDTGNTDTGNTGDDQQCHVDNGKHLGLHKKHHRHARTHHDHAYGESYEHSAHYRK